LGETVVHSGESGLEVTGSVIETVAMTDFRHAQIAVEGASLHVVEAGDPMSRPVVFLHGWPESWLAWAPLMDLAATHVRAIALDLPGIGRSSGDATNGSKRELADMIHRLVQTMDLTDVTIVGHDVGGMIAYSYLRAYEDLAAAVIMDVVLPGVDPWEEVLRNPYLWHFAMHSIPDLPELLVQGHQAAYFDYFYLLAADPSKITPEARKAYVEAYRTDSCLTAGFNWYRAFASDAADNQAASRGKVTSTVLYLRGEREMGDIRAYVAGFEAAGVPHVEHGLVPGAGHFTQEEAPNATWQLIAKFLRV
jgi:pimeloyl-ACP methyl ester carboxylesterase